MAIAFDRWTADINLLPFIGVSVHFVDENFKRISFLLDFVGLEGAHTGDCQAHLLMGVLREYELVGKVSLLSSLLP